MKLVIGSDHAGFALKVAMGDLLRSLGREVLDVGPWKPRVRPPRRTIQFEGVFRREGERL